MFDFNIDEMLYNIPAENHSNKEIIEILKAHPEVRFVSLVGIDIGGHDTDEKIPVRAFIQDMDNILKHGVQTDGSSVVLPKIADLNDAKVDIIPDLNVNWYVDHNFRNIDRCTGLPVGTLRIPSHLLHNDSVEVGSRVVLKDATVAFKKRLLSTLSRHPYIFKHLPFEGVEEIEEIVLTSATELEFWVRTPDIDADKRDELSTAQLLKEQYWKRTVGPVRTALEQSLMILEKYDFDIEMGHKEVGGVKAMMAQSGHYDHVMEQLEIDWKFSTALQAADNENQVKYVVRDVFRLFGLDVTFMAKPMEGIAGSGEHTHLGVAAKLKDGRKVNLFSPLDPRKEFMSPLGFGALMGLLKNYDVVNPFISATNDAFNRLKPGYEAPVCVVTSLGHSVTNPSRNRTVLVGLVRDINNPMATRFELRAPNPKSNTYLLIAAAYMAMLDGINAIVEAEKTEKELESSISKDYGQEDFYLEKDRVYRSEKNIYSDYTEEERNKFFGRAPATVWENLRAFTDHRDKLEVFYRENVMSDKTIESYKAAAIAQWSTELINRIVPNTMDMIRTMVKRHQDGDNVDYDVSYWNRIDELRHDMGRSTLSKPCLLKEIIMALNKESYDVASNKQLEMQEKLSRVTDLYAMYKKNLF